MLSVSLRGWIEFILFTECLYLSQTYFRRKIKSSVSLWTSVLFFLSNLAQQPWATCKKIHHSASHVSHRVTSRTLAHKYAGLPLRWPPIEKQTTKTQYNHHNTEKHNWSLAFSTEPKLIKLFGRLQKVYRTWRINTGTKNTWKSIIFYINKSFHCIIICRVHMR